MQKNVEKMSLNYSPNFNLRKRSFSKVKYLIFHYTGMKSEKRAIKRLTNNNSGVSCHYFIKRNGDIIQMVPDLYVAWHAGKSSWKKEKLLNAKSIGIEIFEATLKHYCSTKFENQRILALGAGTGTYRKINHDSRKFVILF